MPPSPHEVTGLLEAWSHGDKAALDKLTRGVYDEPAPAMPICGKRLTESFDFGCEANPGSVSQRLRPCKDMTSVPAGSS